MTAALSEESFRFMANLWANNNKPWFDANRNRYDEHIRKPLKALAEALAIPVASVLPEFTGRAKISRINNDIRFSPGKPLYKQHMWISFGGVVGTGCADLFFGISGSGWSAGAGIGAPKREPLDEWRESLIAHFAIWKRYVKAMQSYFGLLLYPENQYSRLLYPQAPSAIQPLLQAREVWMLTKPRLDFTGDPAREIFTSLCAILPAGLFMMLPSGLLGDRLKELGREVKAPDGEVGAVWRVLR